MTPLNWTLLTIRRPLRIEIVGPTDQAAAALRGLAYFLKRRDDLNGRRIRIEVTIRDQPQGQR